MRAVIQTISVLLLAPAVAWGAPPVAEDDLPSVSFGVFPLPLKRAYVFSAPGLPAGRAELKTPFPNDFPPSVMVMLEDMRKFPAGRGRYYFPSRNVIRVYRITRVEAAPYRTIQPEIGTLQKILNERPSTLTDRQRYHLPDYPSRNAGHCFELKLSYVDASWGSAVCYVTQFTQDGGTPANNEELTYIVQGVSKDGAFYVPLTSASHIPSCQTMGGMLPSARGAITRPTSICCPSKAMTHSNHRSKGYGRGLQQSN